MPDPVFNEQVYLQSLRTHLQMNTRVLLIEDDPLTRHIVRQTLKDSCCFATAPTARLARAMISAYRPDVVILDVGLPDQSGQDVLTWIKQHEPTTNVIVFTHKDNQIVIDDMLKNGARRCVTKPFSREDLQQCILPEKERLTS